MALSIWLLILVGFLTVIYAWVKHHYSYWKRKNIAYIEPFPVLGNLKEMILMQTSPAESLASLYNNKNVQGKAVAGVYMLTKPALLIRDPLLAKSILIKNFNKFANRFASTDPHGDALAFNNLFFIKAPQWKQMRAKITPVFTTGKLKQMFPLVEEIGRDLDKHLCKITQDKNCVDKEVKEISALYGTDVIASVAYGVRAESLKDPNSDFRRNGKEIFNWSTYKAFEFIIIFFLPSLVKLLRVKVFPKESTKFLRDSIHFVMKERIKAGVPRNDLIDILVAFKEAAEEEGEPLDTDLLVAQAAIFFTAGFETSSSVISFGLYELSKNPEVQKRLREEIRTYFNNNDCKITYESLNDMKYLTMVVQEILRMYPPQPFIDRECTLEQNEKHFSLKPHADFDVPNGMAVYYPIFAIQRDPKYFPNPEVFDPERFSDENRPNIEPFTYMPFSSGPHGCIGERLGMLQAKLGIINFLRSHYVTSCENTQVKMELDPKGLLLSAKGGIHLKLVRDPLIADL